MAIFDGDRKYGIIGTIVFHGIVVLILLLFAFDPPTIEYPEPDGILVDFGVLVIGDDNGANTAPEASPNNPQQAENVHAAVATQTDESSVTIKKNKTSIATPEPTISPEEAEKIRQEQEFKKKMDALAGKLSQGGGSGTDGSAGNSATGASTGDPGHPNGTKAQNTKGNPGNPLGKGDVVHYEKPTNTVNCNNPIELILRVDARGNVVRIETVNTALSEQSCIEAAKAAAKKITFPPDSKDVRYAKITYDYSVSH